MQLIWFPIDLVLIPQQSKAPSIDEIEYAFSRARRAYTVPIEDNLSFSRMGNKLRRLLEMLELIRVGLAPYLYVATIQGIQVKNSMGHSIQLCI